MDLYGGAARNFPATQHIQYAGKFKDKWWDASILQFITNQDYKGMFHKKGTEIRVPIRPTVQIRDTTPGGGITLTRQLPQNAPARTFVWRSSAVTAVRS